MRVLSLLGLVLTVCANIASLKQKIEAQNAVMQQKIAVENELMNKLGAVGPFKLRQNDLIAKVSKEGHEISLTKEEQASAWNPVEGNALLESWSISGDGLHIKHEGVEHSCTSRRGLDSKSAVTIAFSCGASLVEEKSWPVKTGYEAGAAVPDEGFDPRVRFWHRCAKNKRMDSLSLCNRYSYIGANSLGYYGCQYLTVDGYCIKSYRHEWVEFNPNDLPFVFNPPSPCEKPPCPAAGRYAS